MISSSILLVCAQRLLRRLCPACKLQELLTADEKKLFQIPEKLDVIVFRPRGCRQCNKMGYHGRVAVHELFVPNQMIHRLLGKKGITADLLKKVAVKKTNMTTLFWDAAEKVYQGITSPEEMMSKIRVDEFDACPDWWLKLITESK